MISIGDIRQASGLYKEMVACYKKYMRGEGRTDNYAKIIGNTFAILKMDLPDTFSLLEPQSASEKVKPAIEPLPGQIDVEDIAELESVQVEAEAEPEAQLQDKVRKTRKWFGGKE